MHRHLAFLFAVLVPLAPSPASAQYIIGERDARAIRVDSVFRPFDRTDSPGCALGVYQDGVLQYGRGYGMASLEHGMALSPRSVLDVGSISKQFTAMAMLILAKEGKLSLDDPIRKYFPEMPAYADRVTWRRALSQTSGLRDLWTLWGQTGRTFAGDTVDALQVITHSAEPNYEPGERYLYTNSGWIMAAQVVYRLTGKTLAQFAEERIFAPLGMRDTRYLADRTAVIPNLAESYAPRERGFRIQRSNYDGAIQGPGGVHTTVEDFGRWLNNYDAATVGGGDIIATMTTATKLNNGSPAWTGAPGQAYAIGLSVGTVRGLRAISHGGSWAGRRDILQPVDGRSRFPRAEGGGDLPRGPDATRQRRGVDRCAGEGAESRSARGHPPRARGSLAQRRARRGTPDPAEGRHARLRRGHADTVCAAG